MQDRVQTIRAGTPDYEGGSIVNLMRTLGEVCGEQEPLPYAPLRNGIVSPGVTARHVVLLVIDGLGYQYLQRHGEGGRLHGHLLARLTSVFPSTTASAVTTYLTGLAPQQHALTGWHMYFSELDAIAAVLPLQPRGPGAFAAPPGALPQRLFGHTPFAARIPRRCVFVSPQPITDSEFNRYHGAHAEQRSYQTLQELFDHIVVSIRETQVPSYIYAYYPELDSLSHEHGVGSTQVSARLAALDEAFGDFLDRLSGCDALVFACADHGFIDSPPERQIDLAQHPVLANALARPLCGERRVAYCYLKPGQDARLLDYVGEHLGDCMDVFPSRTLVERGWFGPGAPDPRLPSRIGDYTLVMRENWTLLDWVPGERRFRQIGVHGGVSADEMHVPLMVAYCAS